MVNVSWRRWWWIGLSGKGKSPWPMRRTMFLSKLICSSTCMMIMIGSIEFLRRRMWLVWLVWRHSIVRMKGWWWLPTTLHRWRSRVGGGSSMRRMTSIGQGHSSPCFFVLCRGIRSRSMPRFRRRRIKGSRWWWWMWRNGSGWIRIKVSMPRWWRGCWAVSSTRGYIGRIGILCCWR
jgi:hypothetical protein